jgi:hypothetical protein
MDGVEKELRIWVWLTGKQRHKSGMDGESFRAGKNPQSVVVPIIQLNAILYYLYAESTAVRPITDTAQCTYK